MKKRNIKKLVLDRETLRQLDPLEVEHARGGMNNATISCDTDCASNWRTCACPTSGLGC